VRSVRNAFTIGELRSMADDAGLGTATIRRAFPARMLLVWRREAGPDHG